MRKTGENKNSGSVYPCNFNFRKAKKMKKIIFGLVALMVVLGSVYFASARSSGLTYHEIQFVDETGAAVTDITSINIYAPDTTTNATIYMDSALSKAITQSITTATANTTFNQSLGTLYWWGPDGYDFTFTNGTNIATNAGHRTRSSSEGRLIFPSYLTNISSADYEDGESVSYGSDDDFIVNGGTTGDLLTFTPVTNGTAVMSLGTTAACCDVKMWGDTAGYDLMWDATDNRLEFDDNAILGIGNDPDWYIVHSAGTTTATGALTHASAQTFSTDCLFTGNAYNVEWDNSSDTLHLLDNAELGIGGATTADGDVVLKHDGTTLSMTTIRASEPWTIGGTTNGFDITYYFATAGTFGSDHDADTFGVSDDMFIGWGNTLAAPDIKVEWDTAGTDALLVEGKTADTEIKIGYTTNLNLGIYGATNSAYVLFDTDDTAARVDFEAIDLRLKDDDILEFGDTAEISMEYDEDGDDNLLIKGAVDIDTTYVEFREEPICTAKLGAGAATGTEGNVNLMMVGYPAATFEYAIIGTATVLGPVLGAEGLDIGLDDENNDGIEVTEGITARSRSAFTMGSDAFYLEVKIYVTDADGSDVTMIGFRSDEGYEVDCETYTDMAAIGLNGVDWYTWTIDDDGATTKTDVTPATEDADNTTAYTVRINVSKALAVTYEIDGAAPTGVVAHDIDTGDVVIPFLYLRHDTEVADGFQIVSWECGLQ